MYVLGSKAIEKLVETKPFSYLYDSVAGGEDDYLKVTAVMNDGSKEVLKDCGYSKYAANHIPNQEWDCPTIREQIAELGQVTGLILERKMFCSWEDWDDQELSEDDFQEDIPEVGNGVSFKAYAPIAPINWDKVKERLLEILAKDEKAVQQCTALLGIDLW